MEYKYCVSERALKGVSRGPQDRVKDMILLFDGRLCSVHNNGNLNIWNIERGACELRVTVPSSVSLVRVNDWSVITILPLTVCCYLAATVDCVNYVVK
jgi:hypothetical protein